MWLHIHVTFADCGLIIKENYEFKTFLEKYKTISFVDNNKNVEIPQKLKSPGGDVKGSLNFINKRIKSFWKRWISWAKRFITNTKTKLHPTRLEN